MTMMMMAMVMIILGAKCSLMCAAGFTAQQLISARSHSKCGIWRCGELSAVFSFNIASLTLPNAERTKANDAKKVLPVRLKDGQ